MRAALPLLLALAACSDDFQPIEPSAQRLALWGYLSASEDTQWIRVSLMRTTVLSSPDSLPVHVTLEDLAQGRILDLRQQTLTFHGVAGVDSAGIATHNFWTTERMRNGAAYRLRAVPANGQTAEVVVRIPADYATDVLLVQRWGFGDDSLRLTGLQFVAMVKATFEYYDRCGTATEKRIWTVPPSDTVGTVRNVPLSRYVAGRRTSCGPSFVTSRTLEVFGSGDPWPSDSTQVNRLGAQAPTRVSNGIGMVAGVVNKTVPYEDCAYVTENRAFPRCRIHYDSTSATLSGRASDPVCGWGVRRASVSLRELDPSAVAGEPAKNRSTVTDMQGRFVIGGLVPGMRYRLVVGRNERREEPSEYEQFQSQPLRFSAGEHATYDLALHRNVLPCPTN